MQSKEHITLCKNCVFRVNGWCHDAKLYLAIDGDKCPEYKVDAVNIKGETKKHTEKAIYYAFWLNGFHKIWIPKSIIEAMPNSKDGIIVPKWFLNQKGIEL